MRRSDTVPLRSFFGEDYRVQAVVCWTQNWRALGSVPDCPAHNSIHERTNPLPQLKLESLLATPTSFWQHRIEPPFAFPQQILQVTKIFSLRPPTFLSIKTNELTLSKFSLHPPTSPSIKTNELTLSNKFQEHYASRFSFYKDQ